MPKEKESVLQKRIIEYLNKIGCLAWRNNTGAFAGEYKGKKRFVRFSPVGSGDIFCVMKDGRFMSIEVKRKGQKPTILQVCWIDLINSQKALAVWVDSWDAWLSICRDMKWPV